MTLGDPRPRWCARDAWSVTFFAFMLRCAIAVWAQSRFPPAGDGQYYQIVAGRIAKGLGYTWLWPDGAVTYAAHYPIGYPAILGGLYSIFGAKPVLAMALNVVAGTILVWSVHRIASRYAGRKAAWLSATIALLHPTFLFYTPAMMTELVSAALVILATAIAMEPPKSQGHRLLQSLAVAFLIGIATLVRPQQLLFAPFLGALFVLLHGARRSSRKQWLIAGMVATSVTCGSVAVCLPWTYRNCNRMGQCVFVSANAGWNLLIGTTPKGNGGWTSIDSIGVPSDCRLVFAEAAKDSCFGRAARNAIAGDPVAWLRLVPAKLERTFDDVGAPGWYLNSSDWRHFDDRAKVALGTAEVLVQRLTMLGALVGLMRVRGRGRALRIALASIAIGCLFSTYAWLGVILLCLGVLLIGRRLQTEPILLCLAFAYATTALVHGVFFGGARYAIVVMPFMVLGVARAWSAGRELDRPNPAV